tara:strand:- start:1421 stop:2113 length:693 start_codon:yes stop_codon:yes gene_type:complete
MNIPIRGLMGHQVLEAFAGIAHCLETGQTPTQLTVYCGGVVKEERLTDLFESVLPITEAQGTNKTGCWKPYHIHNIFKYREVILNEYLKFEKGYEFPGPEVLHIRGKDKAITLPQEYSRYLDTILDTEKILICTNDREFTQRALDDTKYSGLVTISTRNDIQDWYQILYASNVVCTVSSYVFSTLLINPNKKIQVFPKDRCHGEIMNTGLITFEPIDAMMKHCPNLEYVK